MNKSMEIFEDSFIMRRFQSTSFWSRLVIKELVKFEKGIPYDFYQKRTKIDKFE